MKPTAYIAPDINQLPPAEKAEYEAWLDLLDADYAAKMKRHEANGTVTCDHCNTAMPKERSHCPACGLDTANGQDAAEAKPGIGVSRQAIHLQELAYCAANGSYKLTDAEEAALGRLNE